MSRPFISAQYYATYHYASIVRNILHDQFSYLRSLDAFYGDDRHLAYVRPFSKRSAFHCFIQFVIADVLAEEMGEVDLEHRQRLHEGFLSIPDAMADLSPASLPIDEAFAAHAIAESTFVEWLQEQGRDFASATEDDIDEFTEQIRQGEPYERLLWQFTQEVFFVLFQNRQLLMLFNGMMARQVQSTIVEFLESEDQRWFRRDGRLRRARIPSWVLRAVFFRDRGLCVFCRKDLTRLINIGNRDNYDHIVPLAQGGLNDVSNIQLLCAECNASKHAGAANTSLEYEAWFDVPAE